MRADHISADQCRCSVARSSGAGGTSSGSTGPVGTAAGIPVETLGNIWTCASDHEPPIGWVSRLLEFVTAILSSCLDRVQSTYRTPKELRCVSRLSIVSCEGWR